MCFKRSRVWSWLFAAFAFAFALHVVGGATDQVAFRDSRRAHLHLRHRVPLLSPCGSPGSLISGSEAAKFTYTAGVIIGTGLTSAPSGNKRSLLRGLKISRRPSGSVAVAAVILLVRSRLKQAQTPSGAIS